jgi:hypothetical protein
VDRMFHSIEITAWKYECENTGVSALNPCVMF